MTSKHAALITKDPLASPLAELALVVVAAAVLVLVLVPLGEVVVVAVADPEAV